MHLSKAGFFSDIIFYEKLFFKKKVSVEINNHCFLSFSFFLLSGTCAYLWWRTDFSSLGSDGCTLFLPPRFSRGSCSRQFVQ